jgi:hypothetical protein
MRTERDEHRFLIRLWREIGGEGAPWRGSIEDVPRGDRYYFSGLTALSDYLEARILDPGASDTLPDG